MLINAAENPSGVITLGFKVIETESYPFFVTLSNVNPLTLLPKFASRRDEQQQGTVHYLVLPEDILPLSRCLLFVCEQDAKNIKEIVPFWNDVNEYKYNSQKERESHYLTTIKGVDDTWRLRWYPYVLLH